MAGIPAQARLVVLVEQSKGGYGSSPDENDEAMASDAVCVARPSRPAERATESEGDGSDGSHEIAQGDEQKDQCRVEVCSCRPGHGQLALAEVEIAIATADFEGVSQEDNDGAAQYDDEQT